MTNFSLETVISPRLDTYLACLAMLLGLVAHISAVSHATWPLVQKAVEFGYSPWATSEALAKAILEASPDEQPPIIQAFAAAKRRELETVVITVSFRAIFPQKSIQYGQSLNWLPPSPQSVLVASLDGSLMSWNWFPIPPYPAKVAVLCSLIHSLMAVAIATEQMVAMGRVSVCRRHDTIFLWLVLGYDPGLYGSSSSRARPRRLFSFAWQAPTMLLGSSVVLTFLGLVIHVYDAARTAAVWGPETITAICVTISLFYVLGTYCLCWATLEWTVQEQIRS